MIAALKRFRVKADDIDIMLQGVQADDATAGVSDHFRLLLKDALTHTHFFIRGLDAPCQTHRGTRPGDPLGDLLYNMGMALVMKDARDSTVWRAGQHGLALRRLAQIFWSRNQCPFRHFLTWPSWMTAQWQSMLPNTNRSRTSSRCTLEQWIKQPKDVTFC